MQISLLLMEEIAKLFAIMLMGYAVVKAGLMKSSESKSISVVMVYLVIPCVIIDAFQVDYTPDVKKGLLLACAAAVLVHVLFLILTTILKQVLRLDTIERATVIYSNAGILVIPLVQDLLGKEYVIYSSAYIADVPLKIVFTKKRNYLSTVLRLIVYPIFILILMKLIHTFAGINDSKQILLTVYIASITPACATVTSMAQLYDKDAAYASSLYVLTTLLSIVTMPVMVGMYEMFV